PFFYGRPSGIASQLGTWITTGTAQGPLWLQIATTLEEAFLGFLIGVALGVVFGVALGRVRLLSDVFAPYIKALNAMPRVVLGSIFIITIGYGIWSKVALAVVLVFFVVFFNAFQGVREVDRVMIANARILGATERQLSSHVTLPSALSWILGSLHTSFGFALVGAGSAAASAATASLTIMVGGLNKQIYLPNKLTEALGYFKDQNLTVNLIDEPSGKDATTALIAGEVEGSSGSYDHAIDVAGLGKNLVEVVQLLRAPGEAEMLATAKANDIKGPADFK